MEQMNLEQLWEVINEKLTEHKEPYARINGVYEFNVIDRDITYQISFRDGEAFTYEESKEKPDCTLSMKEEDFKKLLFGKLNSTLAFMTGKLKVKGNIQLALVLEKMLNEYELTKD